MTVDAKFLIILSVSNPLMACTREKSNVYLFCKAAVTFDAFSSLVFHGIINSVMFSSVGIEQS